MKWLLILIGLFPLWANAGTIYLCKAYNGATFWSSEHCQMHQALIDRIVSVPANLPFDQQVNLAEQERAQREALSKPSSSQTVATTPQNVTNNKQAECASISATVAQLDSMARQPQSGQTQDSINVERRKLRDRQFALRC